MLLVAAAVCLLAGIALQIWAAAVLGWRRALDLTDAPPNPVLPPLVFRGPFRIVRHPQSLGLLFVLASAALGFRSVGMAVLAVAAGALVVMMAIRNDQELADRFGPAYARYQAAVPLLVPWLR